MSKNEIDPGIQKPNPGIQSRVKMDRDPGIRDPGIGTPNYNTQLKNRHIAWKLFWGLPNVIVNDVTIFILYSKTTMSNKNFIILQLSNIHIQVGINKTIYTQHEPNKITVNSIHTQPQLFSTS